ncbi:hypothetical protein TRFO_03411 [Tritrichomonas foetus]|uniref:Uncharacterized protein n=1 Tax=Tritrichomonas foetus TaxID=1144522 RepID=A0A1J4KT98_9EUKA|nr:hypothetical protein TRFO_03411 [Tritrichomonas foetus]|eukprot:OHT13012.1 hypothetical protein TRFO_03411 [Tritrichomonas foetus]
MSEEKENTITYVPRSPSNITKILINESTSRSVKVYKQHELYRRRYMREIWETINGTDYLITIADDSAAIDMLNRTSPKHKINGQHKLTLTREEIEELMSRDPRRPFLHYTSPGVIKPQSMAIVRRYELLRLNRLLSQGKGGNFSPAGALARSRYHGLSSSYNRQSLSQRYPVGRKLGQQKNQKGNGEEEIYEEIEEEEIIENEALFNEEEENLDDLRRNLNFLEDHGSEDEECPHDENNNQNDLNEEENQNAHNHNEANQDGQNQGENTENQDGQNQGENDGENKANGLNNGENDGQNQGQNDGLNRYENEEGQNHNQGENAESNTENINNSQNQNDNIIDDQNAQSRSVQLHDFIENEEEEVDIERDLHLDIEYPPGFGPNSLGIDAFALQREALTEDSSDDGDERPCNCGSSIDGYADTVLQIYLSDFIPTVNQLFHGDFTLLTVPKAEFDNLKAKGFDWILFEDLPKDINFKELSQILHNSRLRLIADYVSDEVLDYFDGVRVNSEDLLHHCRSLYPRKTYITKFQTDATYFYNERPIMSLRERNPIEFANSVNNVNEDLRPHFLHYMNKQDLDFNYRSARTAAAMLLTLPGMRVVNFRDLGMVDLILIVLSKKALRRGVFSLVNITSNGNMVAWKYTRGQQHILIAANFGLAQVTGHIICEDAPMSDGKIKVVDILTQTTYMRDPKELRTTGLTVILYEYEIQIFEY